MFTQKQNGLPSAAAAAAVAGAATLTHKPSQEVIEVRQESQISTAYALSPYLRANDLKVTVREGRATLTGNVADSIFKDLAQQIALGVDGISAVDNHIEANANYLPPMQATERGFGDLVDDATLSSKVRSKLLWSRHGESIRARVETVRGKVSLSGFADSAEAKMFATSTTVNTRGVRSVDNQLAVEPADADATRAEDAEIADAWITTKVNSTFLHSTNLDDSDIVVSTQRGIVKLTGKVDSVPERAAAIEIAGAVRGVKSVDSTALTI
jgi:hyperosmotically inducible periplasmic protein